MHQRPDDLGGIAALEDGQAVGLEPARRGGVEHHAAADGRLGAQHDAVAARRDERLAQPELRVRPRAGDARRYGVRAEVDGDGGRDRRRAPRRACPGGSSADSGPARRARRRARRSRRPTAGRLTATRWPASARSTGASCTCTERTRTSRPSRLDPQQIAGGDRPRPERARRDRPDSLQREDAVDIEAGRALGVTLARRDARECRTQSRPARRRSSPRPPRPRRSGRARAPRPARARASRRRPGPPS